MEYFCSELSFSKKPIKAGQPEETIVIKEDQEYMIGLVDEVHRQIGEATDLGLNPVSVLMNHKTYEQMLLYNYNLNDLDSKPKHMFGLIPIITNLVKNYEVEVVCVAFDEFLYREELSQVRYSKQDL